MSDKIQIPLRQLPIRTLCFAFLGFVCAALVSGEVYDYRVAKDSKFIFIGYLHDSFNVRLTEQ